MSIVTICDKIVFNTFSDCSGYPTAAPNNQERPTSPSTTVTVSISEPSIQISEIGSTVRIKCNGQSLYPGVSRNSLAGFLIRQGFRSVPAETKTLAVWSDGRALYSFSVRSPSIGAKTGRSCREVGASSIATASSSSRPRSSRTRVCTRA